MKNTMKEMITRGEAAYGVSLMFPSPQLVEMIAYAGFDWVLIDCEHGSIGPADVEVMAMAADASGITPIGRPRSNSTADIQSILDRGVKGVQVPHVNTREDAQRAVAAVKFGPGAQRGLAAGTRPDRWGMGTKMSNFVTEANEASLMCIQIEHADAVANIDDLLSIEEIDVYFIGPSDLSQSMGYPGDPKAPPVAKAINQTLERINDAGRAPGMPAASANVAEVVTSGCKYIYTHLPKMLDRGATDFLRAARGSPID